MKRQESVYKALEQVVSINTSHKGLRGKNTYSIAPSYGWCKVPLKSDFVL